VPGERRLERRVVEQGRLEPIEGPSARLLRVPHPSSLPKAGGRR
jgi:hypothetical protein